LCYEVSDRNGHEEALAGVQENIRFLNECRNHPRIRGVFGLHASFTLCAETLAEVARRRPAGAGCHIHVAEDALDVDFSREEFGLGPVERLERFGLLDERCLLAHGIHLQPRDYENIARRGGVVIHNPESNDNNRVGRLDIEKVSRSGCAVGLGTDGMSSSMLRAWRAAYRSLRAAGDDSGSGFRAVTELLFQNAKVARRFFDEPLLGALAPGAPADIIAMDAPPVAPLREADLFGQLLLGVAEAPVRHTIARGRVLLEDFVHTTLDPAALAENAAKLTPALQERFAKLAWGTSFLGEPSVNARKVR
jgi:cytosine/adenosine deaminase-related metal-dependent hydrolase